MFSILGPGLVERWKEWIGVRRNAGAIRSLESRSWEEGELQTIKWSQGPDKGLELDSNHKLCELGAARQTAIAYKRNVSVTRWFETFA